MSKTTKMREEATRQSDTHKIESGVNNPPLNRNSLLRTEDELMQDQEVLFAGGNPRKRTNKTVKILTRDDEEPKWTLSQTNYANTSGYFAQPVSHEESPGNTDAEESVGMLESRIKPKSPPKKLAEVAKVYGQE